MLKTNFHIIGSGIAVLTFSVKADKATNRIERKKREYCTRPPQFCKLCNMLTMSYQIEKCAIFQKDSRELHYNTDHPNKSTVLQYILL